MTRRDLDQRGFTLVEIMVVVVLIGILAGMIVVKFDFNVAPKKLHEEIRRFDVLFHMAWEQAQIEGRSVGVEIDRDGFAFYTYDPLQRQWLTMENDTFLRRTELPEGMSFDLRLEDKAIELPTDEESEDDNDITPQVLLLASGDATPFSLFVEAERSDVAYELIVDPIGDSEIIEHDRGF